jgi:tetratricopeptide (TPR) repeat protein
LQHYTGVLTAEKKFDQARQELDITLTPAFAKQPASVDLLSERVDLLACQGRWKEAASDQALALEYQTSDHYHYHKMAGLLVMTRNRSAYEQLCARILATFTNTTNPYIAERMAGDCLEWSSAVDLQVVDKLADKAVKLGKSSPELPYFEVCKALSVYRLGHYAEAIEWANKSLTPPSAYAQAKAYAILAMAHWRFGDKDEAKAMLAKGDALSPTIEPSDPPGVWVAWLCARILLDEATHMVQPNQ